MKAAYVPRYGPPEVVEIRDVPTPAPAAGEIRIRVLATAVTAGDWRVRSGVLPRGFGALRGLVLGFGGPRKAVLGTDAAGVVEMLGEGVTRFEVGQPVVAFPGSALGGHAELLVMPADGRVVRKPSNLTFEEAVSLPFGGMTALDFLRRGDVRAGERVLVNGASGSVGTAVVQLAKHLGAHVTAACSAANAHLVRSLGADEVVDYAATDLASGEAQFDVIVDTVGNAPYSRVKRVLAPGGRLLAVLADLPATLGAPFVRGPRKHRVIAGPAAEKVEDLAALAELAAKGTLRPVIDQRFPFERIADAHRVVDSRRKKGSVVVTLDPRAAAP
ncbi:MAG TPA: NAD(P)-dependent alcohol dehydrogenase [Anaeromyxobacteraceae bacterium]|nr:NAD(P)-dependent alcohol dehydrogenase [Anaeromyxobacteraceae bacterium]